jgi:hypothetical protein
VLAGGFSHAAAEGDARKRLKVEVLTRTLTCARRPCAADRSDGQTGLPLLFTQTCRRPRSLRPRGGGLHRETRAGAFPKRHPAPRRVDARSPPALAEGSHDKSAHCAHRSRAGCPALLRESHRRWVLCWRPQAARASLWHRQQPGQPDRQCALLCWRALRRLPRPTALVAARVDGSQNGPLARQGATGSDSSCRAPIRWGLRWPRRGVCGGRPALGADLRAQNRSQTASLLFHQPSDNLRAPPSPLRLVSCVQSLTLHAAQST